MHGLFVAARLGFSLHGWQEVALYRQKNKV